MAVWYASPITCCASAVLRAVYLPEYVLGICPNTCWVSALLRAAFLLSYVLSNCPIACCLSALSCAVDLHYCMVSIFPTACCVSALSRAVHLPDCVLCICPIACCLTAMVAGPPGLHRRCHAAGGKGRAYYRHCGQAPSPTLPHSLGYDSFIAMALYACMVLLKGS